MSEKKSNKGPTPFDYSNSINSDVECQIGSESLPLSKMNRFMLIRTMMTHLDTVTIGNIANTLVYVPDEYIFRFLHSMIQPKKKRFGKFPKMFKEVDRDKIDDIIARYHISSEDARLMIKNAN